jgi:hypothetical protein
LTEVKRLLLSCLDYLNSSSLTEMERVIVVLSRLSELLLLDRDGEIVVLSRLPEYLNSSSLTKMERVIVACLDYLNSSSLTEIERLLLSCWTT